VIVDRINSYLSTEGKPLDEALLLETGKLAAWAFNRQFGVKEERKSTAPYFSSIGKCIRQQVYGLLGFEASGKEIDSRAKMVFFQGDIVELAIVQIAKIAGCTVSLTGFEQTSVEWNGMRGRPDGVIEGTHLLEVKSMSSYGFGNFERGELDEGYRYQCNAGMEALKLDKCVIVGLNKDAGVLHEMIISKDADIVADIQKRLDILKAATKENLPERPYAPNDKGFYPWQCRYCAHYKTCLPNAELVLVKNAYKLKEAKNAPTAPVAN
jgi:hypothetical protein